jgi:hypothetical protein
VQTSASLGVDDRKPRICDGCVYLAQELVEQNAIEPRPDPLPPPRAKGPDWFRCSFCDTHRSERGFLVTGPRVYICDQCVGEALAIVEPR